MRRAFANQPCVTLPTERLSLDDSPGSSGKSGERVPKSGIVQCSSEAGGGPIKGGGWGGGISSGAGCASAPSPPSTAGMLEGVAQAAQDKGSPTKANAAKRTGHRVGVRDRGVRVSMSDLSSGMLIYESAA